MGGVKGVISDEDVRAGKVKVFAPEGLNPLPPVQMAKKYLELMGGPDEVPKKAQVSFQNGEYRWLAEVVNHVLFCISG